MNCLKNYKLKSLNLIFEILFFCKWVFRFVIFTGGDDLELNSPGFRVLKFFFKIKKFNFG